jgi:hypothetical protein
VVFVRHRRRQEKKLEKQIEIRAAT